MNIVELKKSLDSGKVENLYILTGDEYTILNIYIDKICRLSGADRKKSDNVLSVYKGLGSRSLLSSDKQVYVVRDDKEFLSSESLWSDIEKKLAVRGAILVLKYSSIDTRSKFYKKFSDHITVFDRLSDNVLLKYIFNDINLSKDNAQYLIDVCNKDYGRILLEIDKLNNLSKHYNISPNDAFKMCLSANAIYIEPDGQVFDLVDSILTRNYRAVYPKLSESRRRGDNELYIFSVLHNNVKNILQIQTFGNSDNKKLIQATGLTQFQINTCSKYLNRYTCEELVRFMKYIRYCDKSVKDGTMQPDFAVDYLLVNVL